jgi:hypothetical protein
VGILTKDVDLRAATVRVYAAKVQEWRYCPLTDEVVFLLQQYFRWKEKYFARPSRVGAEKDDDGPPMNKSVFIHSRRPEGPLGPSGSVRTIIAIA